jgi:hypothetical protein
MCCAAILALMLFMVTAKAAPASALLFLTSFVEMDRQQLPAPGDSGGKPSAGPGAAAPRPNPDASGKYHVGDGVTAPKLVFARTPSSQTKHAAKSLGERWLCH